MVKIFVIEDDQFLGSILKRNLEKIEDAEVHHFLTAQECLSNLHQNPDIITIDFILPDMNGLELMEKIKNYNESISCVIVSGQDKVEVVLDVYKKGASDYIMKNDDAVTN